MSNFEMLSGRMVLAGTGRGIAVPATTLEICDGRRESGRGLPHSKTLARGSVTNVSAQRLGVLQSSGAFPLEPRKAHVRMNTYISHRRSEILSGR
jgi:hypothetical protein